MKIYDCTTYFQENDILEITYHRYPKYTIDNQDKHSHLIM